MKLRRLGYSLDVVITLGLLLGGLRAAKAIIGGDLIGQGLTRVAGVVLWTALGVAILQTAAIVAMAWVIWLLFTRLGKNEERALRLITIALLALVAASLVDAVLKRFTVYTLGSAVGQLFARSREFLSGDLSRGELAELFVKHAGEALFIVLSALLLVLLYKWLARFDLKAFYLRRRVPPRALAAAGLVSALIVASVGLALSIDARANRPEGPNVIFVCIDALRADHLGAYGNPRNVSPFMDTLAREGVMFRDATSQSSWTKPSVATYLTSDLSMIGRVARQEDVLPASAVTLAEAMLEARYATGAIVANPWLEEEFGYRQGFEEYDASAVENLRIDQDRIYDFLRRHKRKPFFLYLHFMDVHHPYEAPGEYREMFVEESGEYRYDKGPSNLSDVDLEYLRGRYQGEIRYLDEKIKALFEFLENEGLRDNTVVVFASDHGEEFQDHGGLGHGTTLYSELLRVPLFIAPNEKLFGPLAKAIDLPVRNVDVMPTILDMCGVEPPRRIDGVSLMGIIAGRPDAARPDKFVSGVVSVVSEETYAARIENGYKYIYNATRDTGELYSVADDPSDRVNLADSLPAVAEEMRRKIKADMEALLAGAKIEKTSVDDKMLKKLKGLGYL